VQFHYGSHYSSLGSVLFFLIRMRPYTDYALDLQGGHFDHADRIFTSIQRTYTNITTSMTDVKELLPEFYYNPHFLDNHNQLTLGQRQNGTLVSQVDLPPWANGSSQVFVEVMRAALESEYVSANLHHWIDLIFGYKQQGAAAVEATNVFFYLTYEGSVDLDAIGMFQSTHSLLTCSQIYSAVHRSCRACCNRNPNCQLWPDTSSTSDDTSPPSSTFHQPFEQHAHIQPSITFSSF
jgi:hypothetical protein